MAMHGWLRGAAIAPLLLGTVACVEEGPAEPTPPPPVVGPYTLTLTVSPVCRLPVGRFSWDVEATASGSASAMGDSMVIRATLPQGDATVDLSLSASVLSIASGSLAVTFAEFGDADRRVSAEGSARGNVVAAVGGRGRIVDGTFNGPVSVSPAGDPNPRSATSCTAADHRWDLATR